MMVMLFFLFRIMSPVFFCFFSQLLTLAFLPRFIVEEILLIYRLTWCRVMVRGNSLVNSIYEWSVRFSLPLYKILRLKNCRQLRRGFNQYSPCKWGGGCHGLADKSWRTLLVLLVSCTTRLVMKSNAVNAHTRCCHIRFWITLGTFNMLEFF